MNQNAGEPLKSRMFHVSRAESRLERFALLTHFGTRAAAQQRAQSVAMAEADLMLYEVDIHVGNALRMPDLDDPSGSNNHSWVRLADVLHYQEKVLSANERHSVFVAGVHSEAGGVTALAAILRSKGFDSVAYENRFEDAGSNSIIILREDYVSILNATPYERKVPATGAADNSALSPNAGIWTRQGAGNWTIQRGVTLYGVKPCEGDLWQAWVYSFGGRPIGKPQGFDNAKAACEKHRW